MWVECIHTKDKVCKTLPHQSLRNIRARHDGHLIFCFALQGVRSLCFFKAATVDSIHFARYCTTLWLEARTV